jgi:hypothetical protein
VPEDVPLAIVLFLTSISHVQRVELSEMTPVGYSLIMGLVIAAVCAGSIPFAKVQETAPALGGKAEAVLEKLDVPDRPGTIP